MIIRLFVVFIVVLAGFLAAQVYFIYSARSYIQNIPEGQFFGPANADLTVVEFMDYTCTFCQQVHPTILEAVEKDGNVKYAPYPIKSYNTDGTSAAYIVYAAAEMGKFQEAHNYLMENHTNLVRDRIPEISSDLGLNEAEFTEHLDSGKVYNRVEDNHKIMDRLNNFATPTFFIGPDIRYVPKDKMPTVDDFLKMFAEARGE